VRYSERSPIDGRFVKVDPQRDLVPEDVSAEDVYIVSDNSLHGEYDAPPATDAPVYKPLPRRSPVDEYGLRDPFGRVDQHLVERAQAGTDPVPGTDA